jgi:carbon storage regulator
MLILSRKKGEEIKVGPDITLTILTISENQVKVGIAAPQNVEILRGELYEKVKAQTIEASIKSTEGLADISKLKVNKVKKSDG